MQSPFIPIDPGSLHFPSKRGIPTTEGWERGWFTYYPRITFFSSFWFYLIILWKGLIWDCSLMGPSEFFQFNFLC